MIEPYQILAAIQRELHGRYPEIPILEDLTSADFPRPSFYLDPGELETEDASRWALRVRWQIEAVYFPPVDGESLDAAMEALLEGRRKILELFGRGYLAVGDRALHLTAAGKLDKDAAAVELRLDYLDTRPEPRETAPLMEQIDLQTAIKTEG